jgi:hypothetical protein
MTAKKKRPTSDPVPTGKKKKAAKPPAAPTPEREASRAPATSPAAPHKYSALDAAARILRDSGQPMSCPELIEQMAAKGYWTSPHGKTPASTLYAAIAREVKLKGAASRFIKSGPGRFASRRGADS